MSNCDVPDHKLFPEYYKGVESVRFSAGLELPLLHIGLWVASGLPRSGLVDNLAPYAAHLKKLSELFLPFGSSLGGMFVELVGMGLDNRQLKRTWWITADEGHGPFIPCIPSVILAKKLANGKIPSNHFGARPCLSMFTVEDIDELSKGLNIKQKLE